MDGKYCQGYVTLISYLNIWLNILSLILGYSLVHIYSFYFYVLCKWQYIEETLTTIIGGVFLLMFTWYQSPFGLAFIDPLASMAIENTSPILLPFNIMIHMVTIKLSSSSYLLSKNQLLPLLEIQELLDHVDGTLAPPPRFAPADSQTLNIKHLAWKNTDQRLLSLLLSFLTEEAMVRVLGLSTSREV